MTLRYLPTIRHKYLDTIAHTAISTADLLFRRFDVALYCNAANAVFTWSPRLAGMPTALNVDGLERHRQEMEQGRKAVVSDLRVAIHVLLHPGGFRR